MAKEKEEKEEEWKGAGDVVATEAGTVPGTRASHLTWRRSSDWPGRAVL